MDSIPEISDERLEELEAKIKPVARFIKITTSKGSRLSNRGDGDLYYIEYGDPRMRGFAWAPKPTERAKEVNPNPYKTIVTVHDWLSLDCFNPSIDEVLAQIPEEDIGRCVAFEISSLGRTEDEEYLTGETKLYERVK
jgi:hypothetical protein